MTQGKYLIAKNPSGEGYAILQVFRFLTADEQRIACAILDAMQLQKQLDAQRQTATQGQTASG